MFWIVFGILASIAIISFSYGWVSTDPPFSAQLMIVGVIFTVFSISYIMGLPAGQAALYELRDSYFLQDWLILEKNNGKIVRHWIVEDAYVNESNNGWQFMHLDKIHYISGDVLIIQINEPMEQFLLHYKKTYDIDEEQDQINPSLTLDKIRKAQKLTAERLRSLPAVMERYRNIKESCLNREQLLDKREKEIREKEILFYDKQFSQFYPCKMEKEND